MSDRARSPRLELRLNLSPPRDPSLELSTSSSSEGSCVSSEADEETRVMLLLGCLRCLMYVMLSKADPIPKCPKCKSTVLLDFLNNKPNTNNTSSQED
ncbi:protein GL2-INTERACTING REPRESSOR 1-like [Gastrolobium bilobum]|uniref:protein GL2-INTERACTING REPRESSOR 1-like n=1 Tax=Gastrolobium bilobum TaxID=150636 RepID=UPI002AAF2708|nr:protein GL2-INTERACTING REPRESSOR 1-like [Gastrolobium bilobum]